MRGVPCNMAVRRASTLGSYALARPNLCVTNGALEDGKTRRIRNNEARDQNRGTASGFDQDRSQHDMIVIRRRWCDSRRPFGGRKLRRLPVLGVNWRGYVYTLGATRQRTTAPANPCQRHPRV